MVEQLISCSEDERRMDVVKKCTKLLQRDDLLHGAPALVRSPFHAGQRRKVVLIG